MEMCNECRNNKKCGYTEYFRNRELNLKESESYIKRISEKEYLLNRLYYEEIAVDFHKNEGNLCQIESFSKNVITINKMLNSNKFKRI